MGPVPDTIFARASGAGRAGVAVWRVSGAQAFAIAAALSGPLPAPRHAALRTLRNAAGSAIDEGLVLLFPGPASFTGEDVAEFHLHGSRAVEAAFAAAVMALGARPAEAGEFARRALLAGKLDLARIEALSDLIDAETSGQREQALGQYGGRLSALAEGWRKRLLSVLVPLEADIDFPDEEGVPAAVAARAGPAIDALIGELAARLSASGAARRLREGVAAAILGAPNAGKSSLLNALAGAEAAIVAASPGTTRDIVEVRLDLGGVAVLLADTAGLRERAADEIEAEGMRRALARAEAADIRIAVVDPYADDMARTGSAVFSAARLRPGDILVLSKRDLGAAPAIAAPDGVAVHTLSARTGEGMAAFIAALTARARDLAHGEPGALTRARHVRAVETAIAALRRARTRIASDPELAAEDARLAARALGAITGAVGVEDVLGEIFASFCIGK